MDSRDKELLIEAAAGAWRPHAAIGLPVHPAWYDLDEQDREQAFEVARSMRLIEAALDRDGMSSTVHAVLDRIRAASGASR